MLEENITKKEIQEFLTEQTKRIEEKLSAQTDVILTAVDERLESKADRETTDKILTNQDEIITKLDKLLQEKTIGDEQDKRQKKVLQIHNKALKKKKILSFEESAEIDSLRVF